MSRPRPVSADPSKRPSVRLPSLGELADNPALAHELPRAALAELLRRARHLVVEMECELTRRGAEARAPDATSGDDVRVLTTKQLAETWGKKEAQIRELCRTGRLPARKLGPKEWVISVLALREWLPKIPLAESISLEITCAHDPHRAPEAPPAARPYTVEVRRPAGRPPDHACEVGGGHAGHERHEQAPPARARRAGVKGASPRGGASDRSSSPEAMK